MNTKLVRKGNGRAVGVSRLFRAGTKESRMTNAKRARGQPGPRAKSRRDMGGKRGCWERLGVCSTYLRTKNYP